MINWQLISDSDIWQDMLLPYLRQHELEILDSIALARDPLDVKALQGQYRMCHSLINTPDVEIARLKLLEEKEAIHDDQPRRDWRRELSGR